jgi:murein DD-endopeptidase MepM/ murein hydrolase activator NlpD
LEAVMKKGHTKVKDRYVVFMLAMGPDIDIMSCRIDKTYIKAGAVFFAFLVLYSVIMSFGYLALHDDYQAAVDRIGVLSKDNEIQQARIESLYNYGDNVMNKMEDLIKFEGEIRDLVGLNDRSDKKLEEFKGIFVASRGESERLTAMTDQSETMLVQPKVMLSAVNHLDDSIDVLSKQLDIQLEDLEKLLEDVDARLKYLEARPSILPVSGIITSRFGGRKHPFSKKYQFHEGVDLAVRSGTPIKAAGKGVVESSGWNGGYGRVIVINHGYGIKSVYAHNSQNLVSKGDKVEKGQVIAKVGSSGQSTGPHVHFEIHVNGKVVDPIKYINGND